MKNKVYLEPDFSISEFQYEDVLSVSDNAGPDINNPDIIGQPVPPISDGGTYN